MHRGPAAYVLGPPPSRSRDLELEGGVIACHVDYVYEPQVSHVRGTEYSGWLRLYKIFQEAASPVSDLRLMFHLLNNCSLYMSIILIYFLSIYIGNN